MSEVERVAAHIRRTLVDLNQPPSGDDHQYSSLALCVIDAVYSIGVRYESTYRTICDFCSKYRTEHSIDEFLNLLSAYENRRDDMAIEIFRNRQRTSTRSGILKAEAVHQFAKALQQAGVGTVAQLLEATPTELAGAREVILTIPGQGSGISFRYFLMLVGLTDVVKPDRMLIRFVAAPARSLRRNFRS